MVYKIGFTELPSRHRRGMGNCRGHPPPIHPPTGRPRSAAETPQPCRCQRSSWGASPAERAPAPAPPRPLPAPARAPPPARARGGCGLTAALALALGLTRSLPPPRHRAAANGQRRFLAPALTVRWAFEFGPGVTFRNARSVAFTLPAPRPLSRLPHVLGAHRPGSILIQPRPTSFVAASTLGTPP